jgi:outer membrane protein assembly factor BamD
MTTQTRSPSKLILGAALAGATLLTAGCAGGDGGPRDTAYVARDVETLYFEAKRRLDNGQAEMAAALFDEVERQHPYSPWARRAQLMGSFSYYVAKDYNKAIQAAQRFLQIHPGNKDAPYAFYLIALSYYEQISDVQRDQIDLVRDHLAGKEMEIGRHYERSGKWIAAQIRFQNVVDTYETTSHAPEALYRLTETSLALGVPAEAVKYAAVLGANYPGTEWYEKAYELVQDHAPDVTPG